MFCGIELAATYRFYISVSGLPHGEKHKRKEPWQIAKAQSIKTKTGKGDDAYIIKCDC